MNWTLLKAHVTYDSFNYSDYSKRGAIASSDDQNAAVISSLNEKKPTRFKICCKVARTVMLDVNLLFSLLMLLSALLGTFLHPGLFSVNLALFIR